MLAKTPPMGWNSWNTFGENINEQLIKEMADVMVEKGLRDAGYEYLVIDDCWSEKERDADGNLVADHVKFPNGMKAVADYVHSKGLKFGMYSCCGVKTCAGYPGSMNHEFQDAEYFASVGVDLLKYDNCYHPSQSGVISYNTMAMALKASGREILFSMCNWGKEEVWKWARSVGGHMYRSTGDIFDDFAHVTALSGSQKNNLAYSAPGCFNDIDMLICGMNGKGNVGLESGCTPEQYRYHFALWCMFMSPLMIGCDLRTVDDDTLALLKNAVLIRINQDEEARAPMFCHEVHGSADAFICFRHLSDNEYVIGFFKPYDKDWNMIISFTELGLNDKAGYAFELTDCFTGENVGRYSDYFETNVGPCDCKVFLAKLVKTK